MKWAFFLFFTLVFQLPIFGQGFHSYKHIEYQPEIRYYEFRDGKQMVEIDYFSAFEKHVDRLEMLKPRGLSWRAVVPAPPSNCYLFRDAEGTIHLQYGELFKDVKLLSVKAAKKVAIPHSYEKHPGLKDLDVFSYGYTPTFDPYYRVGQAYHPSDENPQVFLIDSLGNDVLGDKYHDIKSDKGLFYLQKGEDQLVLNQELDTVLFTHEYIVQHYHQYTNYLVLRKANKIGLFAIETGEWAIPCEYDQILNFMPSVGWFHVRKSGLNGFYSVADKKEVVPCKYQSVGHFQDGLMNVRINNQWGYIDSRGKISIQPQYGIGLTFSEGLAQVAKKVDNRWKFGYINTSGEEVIPLIYDRTNHFVNGKAAVVFQGVGFQINQKGEKITN